MSGKYIYEVMTNYPQLIGEDKEVWDRFIQKYPDRFDTVDYDVHVGSGKETPEEPESKPAQQWKDLTRKRIDVIGWNRDFATIIKVNKRVGLPTLGQVFEYRYLYHRENSDVFLKPLLIIYSQINQDDMDFLALCGILHEVV
ncbi:hypothetical protein ES705_14267 [subsurface metagenome]